MKSLRPCTCAGLMVLLCGALAFAAEPDATSHSYKLAIASHIEMDVQGARQHIDADTTIHYSWQARAAERTLTMGETSVKVAMDGKETMNITMSREHFVNVQNGQRSETSFDNANDQLKQILSDSFGTPLCKLKVDKNGAETERTISAGPGAKSLVDSGVISNCMIFHPPFSDQQQWTADSEMTMGNGGFAKGKLTYTKVDGPKDTQKAKVTGTLSLDNFKVPGTPLTLTAVSYAITGEQTYDTGQRQWADGKLTAILKYEMIADGKAVGTAKGTMVLTLTKAAQ